MKKLSYIAENIEYIRSRIALAAEKSGRTPEDIRLIAVTKTVDIERMKEAIECGLTDLGENKVQEIQWKYEELGSDYDWHLIGHLQTNKVKFIVDKVKLIHSVDSEKLALEINDRASKIEKCIDILLEVNISGEESKFGLNPKDVIEVIENISKLSNIKVRGLMTIAPNVENPEENRKYFKEMKKLFVDIENEKIDNVSMDYLSMGMTNDYEIAVEEGANIVRIGTGIFGQRVYNK